MRNSYAASEPLKSLFPGSNPLRSNRSFLNVINGGPWKPKLLASGFVPGGGGGGGISNSLGHRLKNLTDHFVRKEPCNIFALITRN